jgi:hypothetical protein
LPSACNVTEVSRLLVGVNGSAFAVGDGVAGTALFAETARMPVREPATWVARSLSVSTAGTERKHSPTRPRAMIPATNPAALRLCRTARPVPAEGSARLCPG